MPLLTIENLSIAVVNNKRLLPVVDDISLSLEEGHTLGIVGESGSGKSLTALAIMGLLEGSQVRVTQGKVILDGVDVLSLSVAARRKLMGEHMAMIFQEPMTSLNPVYRIGEQISEVLLQHRRIKRGDARKRSLELLELVRIPDARQRMDHYPHQLSGGQRQRVMIAMALACDPRLLIADEPTTALDVTVQKEILELMRELQTRTGTAIILISHDLGVIAETCNQVAVMYRGKIVESASVDRLFSHVGHPYTRGLLASIPPVEHEVEWLKTIPGQVPALDESISGCAFHPRCEYAQKPCSGTVPDMVTLNSAQRVLCLRAAELHTSALNGSDHAGTLS